jgi:hypothetical protein
MVNDTEVWRQNRLGRFTSSNIYKLCASEGFGKEGLDYIRTRVFEALSGVPTEKEFLNESAANGLVNEGFALRRFAEKMGIKYLVVQKLIFGEDEYTSTTPDALIIRKESSDGLSIDCSIVEAKSFEAAMHVTCACCTTPQELKAVHKKSYWQTIDQMLIADTLDGYLIFDNPDLPIDKGGQRIIHFRKMQQLGKKKNGLDYYPIIEDLALLKERKEMAKAEFQLIKNKLLAA